MRSLQTVTASAPGKINLQLLVGKPDAQGYHPLYSIFETVGLRETCTASFTPRQEALLSATSQQVASEGTADSVKPADSENSVVSENSTGTYLGYAPSGYPISVRTCVDLGSPGANAQALKQLKNVAATDHLAWKAAAKLVEKAAENPALKPLLTNTQLNLTITKRIPAAGGMAGGSADAAATLVAVNEICGLHLQAAELEEIARTLGADVPACLAGGTSLGLGYGDHITRLDTYFPHPAESENPGNPSAATHHWVMVMSYTGLSTPTVFKAFDGADAGRPHIPTVTDLQDALTHDPNLPKALSEAAQMAEIMENDLQTAAFTLRPDVAEIYSFLETLGALKVMLSGSGPTLAVLVENEAEAGALGEKIAAHPQVAGILITSGPGQPAKVETTH